jgi:hypothetical protein
LTKDTLIEWFSADDDFVSNYTLYHAEIESKLADVTEDMWSKISGLTHHERDYGFFATDTKTDVIPWIVGFYVKPEYRKNNNLMRDMILETNNLFLCCISNTNVRAVKFLAKFCKIMQEDNVKTIFYYKRGL